MPSRVFRVSQSKRFPSPVRAVLIACGFALALPAQTVISYTDGQNDGTARDTTVAAPLELTIATGQATQSGVLSGDGSITKTGAGTLTLGGANTYTGGTTLTSGRLVIGSDANLGATTGALTFDGGTLALSTDVSLTRSVVVGSGGGTIENGIYGFTVSSLSGTGTLTKTGTGRLNLTGNQVFEGSLVVADGWAVVPAGSTFQVGNNGTTGSVAGIVINDGTLVFHHSGDTTFTGGIGGDGTIVKSGNGTLTLDHSGTLENAITVNAGTLQLGAGGNLGAMLSAITNNANVTFNHSNDTTYQKVMGGTGTLTKSGSGTLLITKSNTYSGGTILNAGTFDLQQNDALGTGPLTINGGTVRGFGSRRQIANPLVLNGPFTIGALVDFSGPTALGADATITTLTPGASATLSGVVSGSHAVTIAAESTGQIALSAFNTYTGGTTLASGKFVLGHDLNLGDPSGGLTFNGGTLRIQAGGIASGRALTVASGGGTMEVIFPATFGSIGGTGTLTFTDFETLSLTGASIFEGTLVPSTATASTRSLRVAPGGSLQLGNGNAVGAISGPVVIDGALIFKRSDATTHAGSISGAGSVTQAGSGVLTLSATNTHTGGTFVTAGTLAFGSDANLGDLSGSVTLDGGTLRAANALSSARTFQTGAAGGTFDTAGYDVAIVGFAGPGPLAKSGAGQLSLTGASVVTSPVTVSQGMLRVAPGASLQLGAGGALPALSGSVVSDGTLRFDHSGTANVPAVISGAGLVAKAGAGTLTLSGANTYSGGTVVNAGVLAFGADAQLGDVSGGVTLDGGVLRATSALASVRTITAGAAGGGIDTNGFDLAVAALGGAGALTKSGAGQLALTGASVQTGGVAVSGGTLRIAPGASLQFGSGAGTGGLSGSVTNDGTLAFNHSNALTVSAPISGSGALTKAGSGALTLAGASTFSGGIAINGGTLAYASAGSLGTGALLINSGGTLDLGGRTVTSPFYTLSGGTLANGFLDVAAIDSSSAGAISATLTGTGGYTKASGTTLSFTGSNTYTGGTIVTAGVLGIGSDAALGHASGGITLDGGTLRAVATFTSARILNVGPGGGGLDTNTRNVTFSSLSGSGTLTKSGAGTLSFSTNTVLESALVVAAGNVVVPSGTTLQVGSGGTTGSLSGTVDVSGTLVFNRSDTSTYNGALTSFGSIVKSGAGTVVFTTAPRNFGDMTITAGTLQFGNGGSFSPLEPLAFDLVNNGTFALNHSNSLNFSGDVSGSGSLVKSGNGVLMIGSAQSYTGGTTINAGTFHAGVAGSIPGAVTLNNGTLAVGDDGAFANSAAAITVNGGAIRAAGAERTIANPVVLAGDLDLGRLTHFSGPVTLTRNVTVTSTNPDGLAPTFTSRFANAISGNFGLTFAEGANPTGTIELAGANTYTGPTTINGGTLLLGSANALPAAGPLTLGGGRLATGGLTPAATLGALSLLAPSTIDFGSGLSALAFADSHAVAWTGTLSILNYSAGTDTLRFGADGGALTLAQLNQIDFGSGLAATIDASGFVTASPIPEPSTYAVIAGLTGLGFAGWRRRRQKKS